MELQNPETGETADLPDRLAELMKSRGWGKPDPAITGEDNEEPVPLSHVPGLIDGVSMREITRWVKDGTVPHTLKGRTKLVKLSDVTKAEKEQSGG